MSDLEPLLDADDIQGHVLAGFGRAFELLLGFSFRGDTLDAGKAAMRTIAADVTPLRSSARAKALRRLMAISGGAPTAPSSPSVSIAFSAAGVSKFGGDATKILDPIFQMGAARSATALGDDIDANGTPIGWKFGDILDREPDILLIIASADEAQVLAAGDQYLALLGATATVVFRECGRRIARDAEHFGFVDGISQPGVRGRVEDDTLLTPRAYRPDNPQSAMWARPGQRLTWPGQFVFGYPGLNPDAVQQPGDVVGNDPFLMNGSLLVVRRLSQDVGLFWRAMEDLSDQFTAAAGTPWTAAMAAARVVGRWQDGTPVSLSPDGENTDISGDFYRKNGFKFVTPVAPATLTDNDGDHPFPGALADPQAKACPFFGHIRKVNPRDQSHDFGGAGSTLSSQMLRRGVPFGPDWNGTEDGADRGLVFMSYQTSIQHGFFRLMSEWVKDPDRPIAGGIDPVIGPSPPGGRRLQMTLGNKQVTFNLPGQFVRATGAGYFFTPGIRTLNSLFEGGGRATNEARSLASIQTPRGSVMSKREKPRKRKTSGVEAKSDARIETAIRSPGGKLLAKTFSLPTAGLMAAPIYSHVDRRRLIDQLSIALDAFYVNLNRKKAIYGFDPVRALGLLRLQIDALSDAEFHENIVGILARVRDRHVMFYGRAPYGAAAVLPFMIETCWDNGTELYVVTKVDAGATFKALQAGARVSHWNGIPIDRYVRLTANLFDGGNEASSLARSLAFLTHRPLTQFGPPLEDWVDLRFSLNGVNAEERFSWTGFDATAAPTYPAIGRNLTGFGGDLLLMDLQNARRVLTAPQTFDAVPFAPPAPSELGVPAIQGKTAQGVIEYGTVTTSDGTFGYVRLWSFRANDVDDLVNALAPILPTLPQNGLILDIRGNTGGYIAAGERMLQLFSSQPIVPARFQFRVTDFTRAMASASNTFISWRPSFEEAYKTGEAYTRGIPIEGNDGDYNKIGRKYAGPTVLVSDALAFSTADMFAAGFIDNDIGKVICTDANMAAAGGNNWGWDVVRIFNPDFHLDGNLRADFVAGKLSAQIADAFNAAGVSLSKKATLSPGRFENGDTAWTIQDGAVSHIVRDQPWMTPDIVVYLARSPVGLADLPRGIYLSLTMRRALRVKANEGRVLEDAGIVPNVLYRMTYRDVMEKNQDLFERAGKELGTAVASKDHGDGSGVHQGEA
ncbi:S41 family peptidase (plasmid) [Rhizobium leguminosarum]